MIALCLVREGQSEEQFLEDLPKFRDFALVLNTILFIGLLTAICTLKHHMKAKNKMMNEVQDAAEDNTVESKNRQDETCIILMILMIFDLSYALRVIYDTDLFVDNIDLNSFASYMISLFSGIPLDIVPILLILFLHRKNFRKASNIEFSEDNRTTFTSSASRSRSRSRLASGVP